MTSCSRWMCEANEVTMTRPGASRMMRSQRGGDDLLALGHALALGVRRVGQQQREPGLAEPRRTWRGRCAGRRSACDRA